MVEPSAPFTRFFSRRELSGLEGEPIRESATEEERAAIAAAFDLPSLLRLDVAAAIAREGADGWRLEGEIFAEATQTCVVTLEPVEATVREPFLRVFRPMTEEEAEALWNDVTLDPLGDDPPEPLGEGIDLGAVALEALALGLDPYPRAPGANFAPQRAAPPGAAPLDDDALRPFAALEALKRGAGDEG